MPNADATLIDRAQEVGMSSATVAETRSRPMRAPIPWPFWSTPQHIPGDTNTPPAPDAVWIGSGDA